MRLLEVPARVVEVEVVVDLPVATHAAIATRRKCPGDSSLITLEQRLPAEAKLKTQIIFQALDVGLEPGRNGSSALASEAK